MIGNESNELARLLSEPSTLTGRHAATALFIGEPGCGSGPSAVASYLGDRTGILRIDSADHFHIARLRGMLCERFAEGASVLVDLAAAPHPELFRILRCASRDGTYPCPVGIDGDPLPIPACCKLAVFAGRATIDQRISYPYFLDLFEVVESVSIPEVVCTI